MNNKRLSHDKLLQAGTDPLKAAAVAKLTYIKAGVPGFTRVKKGKGFVYLDKGKPVTDESHLGRIKKLAIPPAWKDVWICRTANGHIQATGIDVRGRKQYRYHHEWNNLRSETKFHHLYEFGKLLPKLRRRIRKDMRARKLTREKVLAAAIDLMQETYIRVGNESYEKQNGSYGLTTLKDRHVTLKQNKMIFCFTGKKGIRHEIALANKRLATIVKQCRDIPGKTLFQYYDENNRRRAIDSSMLNNYIREGTGPGFSAKDIRTWAGSVQAIQYYLSVENIPQSESKRPSANDMLDWVSEKLGNTRNVCKKYYVHPSLVSFYDEEKDLPSVKNNNSKLSTHLNDCEKVLMCILENA